VEAAFDVLRRPALPTDRLPWQVLLLLRVDHNERRFGLEPWRSRRVFTSSAVSMWLLPGTRETCLKEQYPNHAPRGGRWWWGGGCGPTREVAREGSFNYEIDGGIVLGILPDGSHSLTAVSRGGARRTVSLVGGAFAFPAAWRTLPVDLYWSTRAGELGHFRIDPANYRRDPPRRHSTAP
jgi:hypothetical protein